MLISRTALLAARSPLTSALAFVGKAVQPPGPIVLQNAKQKLALRAVKEKIEEETEERRQKKFDGSITPRSDDWSTWYLDLVDAADLVENAPVRGCKILKPDGFALWELIQSLLDPKIKSMGVKNAYFPVLIPVSFLAKEAAHVAGFAKECAVVTHHRLRSATKQDGTPTIEIDPESQLADPYVVRPTSETVVWDAFGRWVKSYRDLPLRINQWANVMRWERRTKPFLRTSEFLWQEGHTAHATREEADAQARDVLTVYTELASEVLAMPTIPGRKSNNERFAGADETYTIEVLTQNGMAIQAGTSHFLGQNFAKAFDVQYQTTDGSFEHVWATSWGVSTRLIGAVIMSHSDDVGLVLPPALASIQVVIMPMHNKNAEKQAAVLEAANTLREQLQEAQIRVHLDDRLDIKPGPKYFEWERKGVPLRLEVGPRDLEKGAALGKMRTGGDKFPIALGLNAVQETKEALENVRQALLQRAQDLQNSLTFRISERSQLDDRLKAREPGFFSIPWGGNDEDEEKLQEETGVTLRCYPFEQEALLPDQKCPITGKPSHTWAIFAKSY